MNFLDLFSGIGGFRLGAEWAGIKFNKEYHSDIDDYANKVYKKHFPDSTQLGDITKVDFESLKDGNEWILTGGFPCQDISIAGKGAGIEGKRSGLWSEMFRAIRVLRPRFTIIENVSAITFRGLDRVLAGLAEIGYDAEWQNIRASDLGAPHRRERIWIVGYPKQLGCTEGANVGRISKNREASVIFGYSSQAQDFVADTDNSRRKRRRQDTGMGLQQANEREVDKRTRERTNQWSVEPNVGRLAHGVSSIMDLHIRRLGYENEHIEDAIKQVDKIRRKALREMWEDRCQIKQASYGNESRCSNYIMYAMSCESAYEKWYLGQRIKEKKELCDLWERICAKPFKETQDLQSGLLIRIREIECNEKMASNRAHRLRCLGNSIVPAIAELLFNLIKEHLNE